jgi:hypothetical protein
MKNRSVPLPLTVAAVVVTGVVVWITTKPANVSAPVRSNSSYAEDRAAIEDLQARYLFALDFHDPDLYVSTFTVEACSIMAAERSKAARRSKR